MKKFRDECGLYVVEGEKMVKDAILSGVEITEIFATEKYADCGFGGIKCTVVSDEVFGFMSDEVAPQGILAVCRIPVCGDMAPPNHSLLLDRVQDPGNVGAVVRLAAACGIEKIFSVSSADAYSGKAVRSSMSGIFHVAVIKTDEETAVSLMKKNSVKLICADMGGENLFGFKAPGKFCLCLGNEGRGVSGYLKNNADCILSVPMRSCVESLNVSVAGGVMLYTLLYA